MSTVDKALETQLQNIQTRTGKTLDDIYGLVRASGLVKHGEIRDLLKRDLTMGHGDANTIAHMYLRLPASGDTPAGEPSLDDRLAEIYAGPKVALRPIHDAVMAAIAPFGTFEIAPKKTYLSLRRKKQFAMVGPATKTRVEVGLNMKDVPPTARLLALPAGGMCQYKVNLTDPAEVDPELVAWIRFAYDGAG